MRNVAVFGMMVYAATFLTSCAKEDVTPTPNMVQEQNVTDRKKQAPAVQQPITGTVNDVAFAGTLEISKFVRQGSQVFAVAELTNVAGTSAEALAGQVLRIPVDLLNSSGTCDILFLQLGPLDLNLLGLVVHLDQVTLEITAESGSGNLLGNLLCAIAGLLDNPLANLAGIVNLLNQILAAL
jgi:hypothetical protein